MDLIQAIREAGVVGAGGAGFPTHVKLAVKAQCVILNGVECEPLLRVDQLTMARRADRVVRGLCLAMEAAGARQGVIATKAHYEAAVEALERAIAGHDNLRLHLMESYYPSGDEKAILFEVTGRVVPSGKLPIDLGCVVINVGTAANIADAAEGKAVIEKAVTMGGDVPEPKTVSLPIGTPFQKALTLAGFAGDREQYALIEGGPCMGALIEDWDAPVTKTTGGLLVLPRNHPLIRQRRISMAQQARLARAICCQCNRCTQLCPRHALGLPVEPHKAMRALSTGNGALLGEAAGVLACSSCGLCTNFACEMGLAPSVVMTALKEELTRAGLRPTPEEDIWPDPQIALKSIPQKRLMARMRLGAFDHPAPWSEETLSPDSVRLPLKQHVGRAAEPLVGPGDRVAKGQKIADMPQGALGAAVHASIAGVVAEIDGHSILIQNR